MSIALRALLSLRSCVSGRRPSVVRHFVPQTPRASLATRRFPPCASRLRTHCVRLTPIASLSARSFHSLTASRLRALRLLRDRFALLTPFAPLIAHCVCTPITPFSTQSHSSFVFRTHCVRLDFSPSGPSPTHLRCGAGPRGRLRLRASAHVSEGRAK